MLPGALGLLGATGAGLAVAPALRALTYHFFALTFLALGRTWYLEKGRSLRGNAWRGRSRLVLIGSTLLAVLLWGLRFAGLLGARPWPFSD